MDDRTLRSVFEREGAKEQPPGAEPSEADLSPEDQEKIRLARDLMTALTKSFKALRLYSANNELLQKFQGELVTRFQDFFKRFDTDLALRIRQSTITLLGQPIYRSQDQAENLAQRLYRDGFRRITFHEGIPESEILGFLEVLKKTSDHTMDFDFDAVTLFWEKDFKFVTYHAVEDILPEGVDPNEVDAQADIQIERIATLNFVPADDAVLSTDETFAVDANFKRQDIFDNQAPSEEAIMKTQLIKSFLALEPVEIKKLKQEIQNEKMEDLLLEMTDTIIEVIYIERNFDDFRLLLEALEQVLAMYLNFLDLERATEILKRLHHLAEGYRQTSAKAAGLVDDIIERCGSEDRLQALFLALSEGHTFSITTLGTFLVHLGASAIPAICRSLNETSNQDMRKNLCDVLILLGKKHLDKILEHIDDKTERGIRNKIYILGRLNDERSVPFLRKLIQHPKPDIRQLTVASLGRMYNGVTRDLLIQALRDSQVAVRVAVLKTFAQVKDERTLDIILPLVREAAFHEKELGEKRIFFQTMATLGGNDLAKSFGDILMRKNLKDLDKDDAVRVCAAEALGQIGTRDAVRYLKEGLKTKRKAIMQACEEQLAAIEERLSANAG